MYNGQDYESKFSNGSKIGFVEAARRRRNGQKIKVSIPVLAHIDGLTNFADDVTT